MGTKKTSSIHSSSGAISISASVSASGSATGSGSSSSINNKGPTQQQTFTSKYIATPTSEASTSTSTVISPYRARSSSRYNSSATYSPITSEDQTTMTAESTSTTLQDICSYCIKLGDCIYYSVAMLGTLGQEMSSLCHSLTQIDILLMAYKSRVLWERNFKMFFKRERMIVQTTITVVGLALCFGFVLGPSKNDYLSVLGMFAIGNLCIILTNMQYIAFLFMNNQV
jgi:hypothetical protein